MPDTKVKGKKKKRNALARWWNETIAELRKVTWPTPKKAWQLTKIVIVVVFIIAIILGVLDNAFTRLITFILS
ncbi:MAG TPA: preprotein translocase subunit SecE [Anaerolineae bacterium]|nr:preprotein translocase subunit SecE [Anaerolineae bacterium]